MKQQLNRYFVLIMLLLSIPWRGQAHPGEDPIKLITALQQLQNTFHVNFNYSSAAIADKYILQEQLPVSGSFDAARVNHLLRPLGLMLEQLSSTDYAVRRIPAAAKQANTPDRHTISGTIRNEKGEPVPGATISDPASGKSVISDEQGRYVIETDAHTSTLVFRSIGYFSKEVKVDDKDLLNVQMVTNTKELSAVVVTALGIKREEKALGYSIATMDGSKVNTVKDVNVLNSLSGKVAGVDIRAASSDPGASVLVTIRGSSSIANNNRPLFVVDGVPVASANRSPSQPVGQVTVDYGSPVSDINPDDIASITVLKGASAAALYGSRAANGVILIVTKTGAGKARKGLNVNVNFSAIFDKAWQFPDFQNEFGAGDATGSTDPTNTLSTSSWGPRLDQGAKHIQWNSPRDASGNLIATDWVAYPNRVKDFFQTGSTYTSNVAVTGSNFRLSYTNLRNTGITPNTDLQRNTINLSAGYELSRKIKVTTNVGYTNNKSDNRPTFNRGSSAYILYTMPANINSQLLKNYWMAGKDGLQQFSQDQGSTDNPYFVAYQLTNGYNRNHLTGNVQLTMELAKGLTLMGRSGLDMFSETDESKRAFSAVKNPYGGYYIGDLFNSEQNTDFLLTYKREINKDWSFFISGGGNRMDQRYNSESQSAGQLVMPGVYNISNAAAGTVANNSFRSRKRINSLYSMGEIAFRSYAFLDLTARNDWSSTLPAGNNAYFYPSASLSLILSDMLHLNNAALSYAKLRLNWSKVGKDTDPYSLYNNFYFSSPDWGNVKMADFSKMLKNNNLKPEIATSYEVGTELKFFHGRLGLDATWYTTNSRNQIIQTPTTMASGYNGKIINAGEIRNRGWEISLNGTPVAGKFIWETGINFTRNRNKVIKLSEGITQYLQGNAEGIDYQIREGQQLGDMWGVTWKTVPDGPFKGKELLDNTGHSQYATDKVKIGNYNPDFMLGFSNTFTYQHWTLNMLIDWRMGGQFFSYMYMNLLSDGRTTNTLQGRDPQHGGLSWNDGSSNRTDGMIEDGYVSDGNGGYVKNTNITDPESYYGDYYWKMHSRNTFSATYVKLRELSLSYLFSKAQTGRLPVSNLSIAFIARNLFSWTAAGQGYDPETAMTISSGGITPGTSSWSLPYTRSYGVKLGLNF
ncbi:SusC/RagA family TonB-linked outer membrane protein [Chitinophaga vietnamensis]|uniref:SusC/RagA family TonB-linked outer membrane protein n=1 Tax=Chitinophaga vietnamensis TaxID=2593957 RepID=UPI0011788ABC|nr:SusC/RagA family TonB-linked outer membrane protein [Chitinophaga vietnamensis]